MDPTITPADLTAAADPDTFGSYLTSIKPEHDHMGGPDHHAGRSSSIRTAEFEGHQIKIVTTYEVTVDGRPLKAGLDVDDDGILACHGLPAYQFSSALDTVRELIRKFPKYFPKDE
ncbi:hypothetical protein F7Q99_33995 [Streptomyces kaniharaensis]|uniref:Uncharacterized protein n=1 Tax=Streptomyces kaniharaensis TaxID=212423 RepID=A0A6N7L018_9ACTN|nr:hypothetical protein [Streptomyces kaniharaensis]MQS17070.1 hypothetical protein [Streptomyces kaniharaensis]